MTTTQVISIAAVIAVVAGLLIAVRVRGPHSIERKPPPKRDPDA